MALPKAEEVIKKLKLEPLDHEGGYFRRVYTHTKHLDELPMASAIYFLITQTQFSALHRLNKSDELFHFYTGSPVEMLQLHPDGRGERIILGDNIMNGHYPMQLVRGGVWQGTRLVSKEPDAFALLGVSVHPAFDWDDFEIGKREELLKFYPNWQSDIVKLTRE